MRAVGEGIEVAPVAWIENFPQAFRTGREVRQDDGRPGAIGPAGANLELPVAERVEPRRLQALDKTARGFLGLQTKPEPLEVPAAPPRLR